MTAPTSRPPGHRALPGAPPHSSGGRARHPSGGEDSTLEAGAPGTERPRPGDLPPTMISPGLTHRISHLCYEEPAYLDRTRRGRAPPIQFFFGEDPAVTVDDWLPSLEQASAWNGWSVTEKLMQLPSYLKGRALQEWRLLGPSVQRDYTAAIEALRSRLDSTNRPMATQEFRHSIQRSGESVADYIRRLEKAYQLAYGKDSLSSEVRDALLYGQLYDGLRYSLMSGPSVSGARNYQELCVAAKGEEHRLAALQQRQQLKAPSELSSQSRSKKFEMGQKQATESSQETTSSTTSKPVPPRASSETQLICYNCGKPGHMARACRQEKQESRGPSHSKPGQSKQVHSGKQDKQQQAMTPESLLYSDSDDEEGANARAVHVQDGGSHSQCVKVQVQGVPVYGLIDTGADITIIGGKLFERVATVARLRKRHFKKPDKIPRTYDQKTFTLDGRMDLEITFDDKTMCTPVYIKMDAADQLLLSEGVCRQLGVVTFHPKVEQWRGRSKKTVKKSTPTPGAQAPETSTPESSAPEQHSSLSLPAASEPNPSEATHPPTTTEAKVPAI